MDNQTLQKIKEALSKSNNIGIVVGRDPSLDEMAAALSLYLLLRSVNKNASIASPSEPIVEISSLVGINKVQSNLGGEAGDLVVSFPYIEGEIEKVSYTLEEGFLNIIVKASEQGLSFDEKDVKFVRGSGSIDLLFVVGTPRLADLGDVFDSQKLREVTIINIDNKANNQQFGDIVLVSPRFSSVSEQVADLVLALGLQINQDVAQNLLSGISFATQNFQSPNTTSLAFEVAALLLKRGAKRIQLRAQRDEREERSQPQVQSQQQSQSQSQKRSWLDELASREDRNNGNGRDTNNQGRRQQEDRQQGDQRQRQENRADRTHSANSASNNANAGQVRPDARRSEDLQGGQGRQDQNRQRPPQQQSQQNRQENVDEENEENDGEPPLDWLTPKVYKGSSDVE